MSEKPQKGDRPFDRLTRIADAMQDTMEAHPEYREGDKCGIFLDDDKVGGLVLAGFASDADALAAILMHIKAIFEANGATLDLLSIEKPVGEG